MKTLIENALITDMISPVAYRGDIVIDDKKIAYVGVQAPKAAYDEVIDATKFICMPGLVNAHTHAGMHYFRGFGNDLALMDWLGKIWPIEDVMTGDDMYWWTQAAIAEMIRAGVTTFADMYMEMDDVAKAVEQTGMRASLSRGMNGNGPNAQKAIDENSALADKWHNGADGRIKVMFGPHAPYTCNAEYLKKVHDIAREKGVGLHIHLSETQWEVENTKSEHGCTWVELLEKIGFLDDVPVLLAHAVHVTDTDIAILSARKNVFVAHNSESNLKLASGIAPIWDMRQKGIVVAIGTDGASSNNTLEMWTSLRLAAFLAKGTSYDPTRINAFQALQMATIEGAKALQFADKIGTLESGKEADIVLVSTSSLRATPLPEAYAHLAYGVYPDDVDSVWVAGKRLLKDKQLLTLDEEKIRGEIETRAKRLFA